MTSDDFARQRRVIDQMVTQHSLLRDRYDRFSRWLDIIGIVLSAVLTVSSLMKDEYWSLIALSSQGGTFIAAIMAAILLGLSIVQYRVQWKEKAEGHGAAARALSHMRGEARFIDGGDASQMGDWLAKVSAQLPTLPPIPDSLFNSLKAAHLRKVEVSRRLDENPGGSAWLVALRVRLAADRRLMFGGDGQSN